MTDKGIALVLGATGGIGGELARALQGRGWHVRALHRCGGAGEKSGGIEWIEGDAMNRSDVVAAATGTRIIVHGVNPPGYKKWGELALPMLDNTIAAAKLSGARILFPGTIYNYGPDAFPLLNEDSPQNPQTRKGRIRVEMEERLREAARDGVSVLIIRAGDFFGPKLGNSWFSQALVRGGHPIRSVSYPGRLGVGHAWAYLPDLAETFMRVLDKEADLGRFERFHFGGHWLDDGVEMARAIQRVAPEPKPSIRSFPWPLIYLISPFVTSLREMLEIRYLWKAPVRLDNRKLLAFLGTEPHTPLDRAVAASLGFQRNSEAAPRPVQSALMQSPLEATNGNA